MLFLITLHELKSVEHLINFIVLNVDEFDQRGSIYRKEI